MQMSYLQQQRVCSVKTHLGPDALMLKELRGREGISQLFHYELEMISENDAVDVQDMVGKDLTVEVELADGSPRFFHGFISHFVQGGKDDRFTNYHAEVRPWMWFLTRRTDCRIFQNMTVPQIIEDVFKQAGLEHFEIKTSETYQPRVYCVQYRETDFAFVSRLMEEVGIFYFFAHEDGKHTLTLVDSADSTEDCPNQAEAHYVGTAEGSADRDEIKNWQVGFGLHPGKVALKDYNFEDPGNPLGAASSTSRTIGDNSRFEVYDYHPCEYGVTADGDTIAKVRMQEGEADAVRISGDSDCRAFVSGHKFTLKDHFSPKWNDEVYLLTDISVNMTQPSPFESGEEAFATYHNDFECVPVKEPFRAPSHTPKPFVRGPQTAVVVGPSGEEIYVDKYGRVKVQFHWDREGKNDENSSCWVRVSHGWASKNWGMVAHPRIGDEVIIEFLEGDPDKPILTGRVYNAKMMPPYDLPANKTQTGIKSRSSKGGSPDNFNEIRFEDKKGSEQVYIHAEKDKQVMVENDRTENVGHDETISIGNDRTEDVGNNETITIGVDRTENVGSNESITIGSNRTENVGANETISIGADRTETVGKNETVTVALMRTHTIGVNDATTVGAAQEVTVGAARAVTVGATQATTVGVNHDESIGANHTLDVGKEQTIKIGKKLLIDVGDEITIKTGKAKVVMKKDGKIEISGKDVTIKGSGKIDVTASKNITMKGKKILGN